MYVWAGIQKLSPSFLVSQSGVANLARIES